MHRLLLTVALSWRAQHSPGGTGRETDVQDQSPVSALGALILTVGPSSLAFCQRVPLSRGQQIIPIFHSAPLCSSGGFLAGILNSAHKSTDSIPL